MSRQSREESLERTRAEILEEQARALARIGEKLLQISETCRLLFGRFLEGDRSVVEEYTLLKKEFERYLWYWTVQREAMGFRTHPEPEEWLFVPPSLDSRSPGSDGD